MLRQTITPLPKPLYDYMTHLAVTQRGRWLEQKHTASKCQSLDSSLCFCGFNKGAPCAMKSLLLNHNLFYPTTSHRQKYIFNIPGLRGKIQSTQKSIQWQVCHWSSLFVVIVCVCACLYSVSSENSHVRCQSSLHTVHSAKRKSIYFESFVSLLQFKGKKYAVNTYQHNHLHFSFFLNT